MIRYRNKVYFWLGDVEIQVGLISGQVVAWRNGKRLIIFAGWL